jgi:hypothetical protein
LAYFADATELTAWGLRRSVSLVYRTPEEGKRTVFCTETAEGGLIILGVRQRIYAKNVHLMVLG